MPRQPRLDALGTLHLINIRGIEKRKYMNEKLNYITFFSSSQVRAKRNHYFFLQAGNRF